MNDGAVWECEGWGSVNVGGVNVVVVEISMMGACWLSWGETETERELNFGWRIK